MKGTVLALALISLLLVVVLTLVNSLQVSASYPSEPVTDPPVIRVYSPSNTTYYENSILVNFTITKPDSWHQDNLTLVTIQQVSYQLDPGSGHIGFMNSTSNQFSAMLKEVPGGQHTLQINILTGSYYYPQRENWIFTETYYMNTRLTINFTVDTGPFPIMSPSPSLSPSPSPLPNPSEPFPTTFVILTSVIIAVIGISLFVYFRKSHRDKNP
jgi:hypothetical protein